MLTKILRNAHFRVEAAKSCRETFDDKKNKLQLELPSVIESWLVLDGALSPLWVDSMSTLLDAQRRLQLANGEQVDLQRECQPACPVCLPRLIVWLSGNSCCTQPFTQCLYVVQCIIYFEVGVYLLQSLNGSAQNPDWDRCFSE